jgi:hypothetical protein
MTSSRHLVRGGEFKIGHITGGLIVSCETCYFVSSKGGSVKRPRSRLLREPIEAKFWMDDHQHTTWSTLEAAQTEATARSIRARAIRDALRA